MNAIKINYQETDEKLFGKSKFWGQPDLPDDLDLPVIPYEDGDDPMTLVCQIRCADLAAVDPDNLLPHEGMLYFFAYIDYYVGALGENNDNDEADYYNGMGEWDDETFRVLYSPNEDDLHTHVIEGTDGEPYSLPAEKVTFEVCPAAAVETKLLGLPGDPEVEQWYPDHISLLQLCEEDRWLFRMYDCGIINFLITSEDLKARRFDRAFVHLHSL